MNTRVLDRSKAKRLFFAYPIDIVRTANQEIEQNLNIINGHDFIVTHIVGNATSNLYQIQLRDSVNGFEWSDGYLNALNYVGSAQLPFKLPQDKWLKAGSLLYYKVKDLSGAGNTIQIVLYGYEKYFEITNVVDVDDLENKYKFAESFAYPVDQYLLGSANNFSAPVKIQVPSGNDFVITAISGTQTGAYTIRIRDNGFNRDWLGLSGTVNNVNIVGTAQYPFVLPRKKFVRAGSTIEIYLADTSTNPNTIQVVLHGYRLPI